MDRRSLMKGEMGVISNDFIISHKVMDCLFDGG